MLRRARTGLLLLGLVVATVSLLGAQRPRERRAGMGFEPLRQPKFVTAEKASFLSAKDRVLGVEWNGEAKAYPVPVVGWHHFIEDQLGGLPILPTW